MSVRREGSWLCVQIQPHLPTSLPSPMGLASATTHFLENPNFNLIPKVAEPN